MSAVTAMVDGQARTETSTPQRRSRDRWETYDHMMALCSAPRLDSMAEVIAMSVMRPLTQTQVSVWIAHTDGALTIAGHYGAASPATAEEILSVWDQLPEAHAARTSLPMVGRADEDGDEGRLLSVAVPIRNDYHLLGVLSLSGVAPTEMSMDDLIQRATWCSALVALRLTGLEEAQSQPMAPLSAMAVDSDDAHLVLSERQRVILDFLVDGLTNRQIAHRIGYSESTVRHETMAIFRRLGVASRREAAQVARTWRAAQREGKASEE